MDLSRRLLLFVSGAVAASAVDGDAYWGPTGLAAGPEFFPSGNNGTAESDFKNSAVGRLVPAAVDTEDALTVPAAESSTNLLEPPFRLGVHVATHSWCLAAVLPVALSDARYGRSTLAKIALDVTLASAAGVAATSHVLPVPSAEHSIRYSTASGVFALAPAVALILVSIRRTYGRVKWQRDNTKEKSESPSKGVIGDSGSKAITQWQPHTGGWQRWEVWRLLSSCGAAQAPILLKALVLQYVAAILSHGIPVLY